MWGSGPIVVVVKRATYERTSKRVMQVRTKEAIVTDVRIGPWTTKRVGLVIQKGNRSAMKVR